LCPSHVRAAFNPACTRAEFHLANARPLVNVSQAHRRPGLSFRCCKGGLVIHLLDPKCPSACLLRGLSVADFADPTPKQRQALLSISLGRCVSPPVFLAVRIVEPLGCSLSLFFPSTRLTSHTFTMVKQKVCLAYSGGLDTSCILRYLLVSRPAQQHNTFVCGPLTLPRMRATRSSASWPMLVRRRTLRLPRRRP
jgi:hypothetical protein